MGCSPFWFGMRKARVPLGGCGAHRCLLFSHDLGDLSHIAPERDKAPFMGRLCKTSQGEAFEVSVALDVAKDGFHISCSSSP